ncbi:MAG: tRNA (adenosine(37)-N6)-threonylcarbamoyltransferase complex dimerization subunit type 1 TsaB [Bacillota bacterium]|jgi:tRNA threonylcarbamoyladenosine biosynthesis protein TsaB
MFILAIDTAGKTSSVALVDESSVVARIGLDLGKTHSQKLLPMVDALLQLAEISLADLDAVAVTVGPGSFTGLRIGLATVKAWSQALQLPLVAVGTLEAAAVAVSGEGYVCPIFDARKNQVYCALFKDGQQIWPAQAVSPQQLAQRLASLAGPILFCGDAVGIYDDIFAAGLGDNFRPDAEDKRFFLAEGAALLARERYQSGQTLLPEQIEPFYLRRSEAEVKRFSDQEKGNTCDER